MASSKEILEKYLSDPPSGGMTDKEWCAKHGFSYASAKVVLWRYRKAQVTAGNSQVTAGNKLGNNEDVGKPDPLQALLDAEKDDMKPSEETDEFLKNLRVTRARFNTRYAAIVKALAELISLINEPFDWSTFYIGDDICSRETMLPAEFKQRPRFTQLLSVVSVALGEVTDLVNELEARMLVPSWSNSGPEESQLSPLPTSSPSGTTVQVMTAPPKSSVLPRLDVRGMFSRFLPKFGSAPPPTSVVQVERVESIIENLKQLGPNFNLFCDFYTSAYYRVKVLRNRLRCEFDHEQVCNFLLKLHGQLVSGARAAVNHQIRQLMDMYKEYAKAQVQAQAFAQQGVKIVPGYAKEDVYKP